MKRNIAKPLAFLAISIWPHLGHALSSAEMYTSKAYGYGRFEARLKFAPGNGVVSSFFLWKDGSEQAGMFWNELDFEKVGENCSLESNAIYGNPSAIHVTKHGPQADLCAAFHTYTYEWTPDAVVWLVDGMEIRHDTGATPMAFAQNASGGMQMHFNIWPGDSSFGGTLDPATLPIHQYIDWVQYSAYQDGTFKLAYREDFRGNSLPDGWLTGSWGSPKNLSTHAPENVNLLGGNAVLSLTADGALGPAGAMPVDSGAVGGASGVGGGTAGAGSSVGGTPGTGGASAVGGSSHAGGSTNAAGSSNVGAGSTNAAGSTSSGAGAGAAAIGGPGNATGASPGSVPTNGGGCSFQPSPSRGASFWAIGIAALAYLHRRARQVPRTAPRR